MYANKLKLTFYLEKHAFGSFFETLLPIIFCNLAASLNFICNSHKSAEEGKFDFNSYLDSNLTIGLTIIFLIPRLVQKESFVTNEFSRDDM